MVFNPWQTLAGGVEPPEIEKKGEIGPSIKIPSFSNIIFLLLYSILLYNMSIIVCKSVK